MIQVLFLVAAAAAGFAQALLLRRAAGAAASALGFPLRLLLVAGVLTAAARAGCLAAAFAGWGGSYALSAALLARRWRWS